MNTSKSSDEGDVIQGFEQETTNRETDGSWEPVSDRKIRLGIAGYGVCKFGSAFFFQNHPNVEVSAVADLDPVKRAELAKMCNCTTTYPSCEEMLADHSVEAVFVATDAPSHARLAIAALNAGKHVASAVPAVFGSLEDADSLMASVKATGLKYMMFETSYFHKNVHCMREMYRSGTLGKVIYAEGEYWHYFGTPLDSHDAWRTGLPPQWYPTHSNAYYIGVTGGSFTEVSCMGMPSEVDHCKPENNRFGNPFGTEVALFRTSEGGMARMAVSWDTPGKGGETGRIRTQNGSYYDVYQTDRENEVAPFIERPPLPSGVEAGGHGGTHGYLMNEFVESILVDRKPLVDVAQALNLTVSGIIAHESALKDGELIKIPQYRL